MDVSELMNDFAASERAREEMRETLILNKRKKFEREEAKFRAAVDSEKHLKLISNNVDSIDQGLKNERKERIEVDEKNFRISEKWHRLDFRVAIIGVAIGALAAVVSVASMIITIVK